MQNHYKDLKMSQIGKIGQALFGQSWMAQVANVLTNSNGESLSRQTVQSWHNRDNVPNWALQQLSVIANQRLSEIQSITKYLGSNTMNEFYQNEGGYKVRYTRLKSNNKIWYREILNENLSVKSAFQVEFDTDDATQDEVINAFLDDTDKYFLDRDIIFDESGKAI